MKARVIKTGKIIDVRHVRDISGNVFYEEIGVPASSPRWCAYWRSELDFNLSEPEEGVTIEGRAERTIDDKLRLFVDYINYVYLPADCKIEGEVTITIKPKKK